MEQYRCRHNSGNTGKLHAGAALYTANKEVDGIISLVDYKVLIVTGVIVFGAGILLTGISAYFAVNRYIKMKYNKLFLV